MKRTEKLSGEKHVSLWVKCPACDQLIYKKDIKEKLKICPKCNYYLRMSARERIEMLIDTNGKGKLEFEEFDKDLRPCDPLGFTDPAVIPVQHDGKTTVRHKQSYQSKLLSEQKKTGHLDAIVCGEGNIGKFRVVLAVLDFEFMAGSMGSVVGEKVTRAIERSLEKKLPLILVSASGGARMQESILSLMQMAKTSAALGRLHEAGILYISLLCDPTTGGVTASFSMLGDVLISEPKALIAFAGPRVIEQTIRQKLPAGFQSSEFLMKHGMIDCIVERKKIKSRILTFLKFFDPALTH